MLTPAAAAISRVDAPSNPLAAKTASAAEDARLGRSGSLARLVQRRAGHGTPLRRRTSII